MKNIDFLLLTHALHRPCWTVEKKIGFRCRLHVSHWSRRMQWLHNEPPVPTIKTWISQV